MGLGEKTYQNAHRTLDMLAARGCSQHCPSTMFMESSYATTAEQTEELWMRCGPCVVVGDEGMEDMFIHQYPFHYNKICGGRGIAFNSARARPRTRPT